MPSSQKGKRTYYPPGQQQHTVYQIGNRCLMCAAQYASTYIYLQHYFRTNSKNFRPSSWWKPPVSRHHHQDGHPLKNNPVKYPCIIHSKVCSRAASLAFPVQNGLRWNKSDVDRMSILEMIVWVWARKKGTNISKRKGFLPHWASSPVTWYGYGTMTTTMCRRRTRKRRRRKKGSSAFNVCMAVAYMCASLLHGLQLSFDCMLAYNRAGRQAPPLHYILESWAKSSRAGCQADAMCCRYGGKRAWIICGTNKQPSAAALLYLTYTH